MNRGRNSGRSLRRRHHHRDDPRVMVPSTERQLLLRDDHDSLSCHQYKPTPDTTFLPSTPFKKQRRQPEVMFDKNRRMITTAATSIDRKRNVKHNINNKKFVMLLCCLMVIDLFTSSCGTCDGFVTTAVTTSNKFQNVVLHVSSSPFYYEEDGTNVVGGGVVDREHVTVSFDTNTIANLKKGQRQQDKQEVSRTSSVSMRLINSIVFNQCFVLILSVCVAYAGSSFFGYHVSDLHWNGGEDNAFRSFFDWQLTPLRLVEGILATIPMIALAHSIEQSEQREAMEVNFSTINMVISLFGRRKSEHDQTGSDSSEVMALSCGVGVSTAISEEIIFRGLLPTFILSLVHSIPVAMAGQAALFAAGHLSPHAKPDENRLVGSLQFANGLWYGLVYLLAGGDILPCIIAHMLYDVHTLCGTYKKTNDQMDYTEQASHYKTPEWEQREIHKMQLEAQGGDALLGPETVEFARRFFFAFDHDHAGSLSRNDVQKACCYAFLQDEVIPDKTRIDELFDKVKREQNQTSILDNPGQDGRLSFPDFLKLLFILRSASA